jgi:excisionase family DNA binding protein
VRQLPLPALLDAYLPLKSLATYAGISVRTLRALLVHRTSPLPHYRIGGRIVVRRSEFDQWVQQFRVHVEALTIDNVVDELLKR